MSEKIKLLNMDENDIIEMARAACERFGGEDGVFSSANFSAALCTMSEVVGPVSGFLVRAILSGRSWVEYQSGAHWRMVELEPTDDTVEWVVNDNSELGVKIGNRFFWLYKGSSLVYDGGTHDDETPMLWRPVGKREFGECCHPKGLDPLPDRYTVKLMDNTLGGDTEIPWQELPTDSSPEEIDWPGVTKDIIREAAQRAGQADGNDGAFNSSHFSKAFCELTGLMGPIDRGTVRGMLVERPWVERTDRYWWKLVDAPAPSAPALPPRIWVRRPSDPNSPLDAQVDPPSDGSEAESCVAITLYDDQGKPIRWERVVVHGVQQALPSASESVLEIVQELGHYMTQPGSKVATIGYSTIRAWQSRLSSAAPGMGTPGEVETLKGMLADAEGDIERQKGIAEELAGRLSRAESVLVSTPQPKAEAGSVWMVTDYRDGYRVFNRHLTDEESEQRGIEEWSGMLLRIECLPVIGAPSKGECKHGCPTWDEHDRAVQKYGAVAETAARLQVERDTALEGERKARTEVSNLDTAIRHAGSFLRGTLGFVDGVTLSAMAQEVAKVYHRQCAELSTLREQLGEELSAQDCMLEASTRMRCERDALAERVRELPQDARRANIAPASERWLLEWSEKVLAPTPPTTASLPVCPKCGKVPDVELIEPFPTQEISCCGKTCHGRLEWTAYIADVAIATAKELEREEAENTPCLTCGVLPYRTTGGVDHINEKGCTSIDETEQCVRRKPLTHTEWLENNKPDEMHERERARNTPCKRCGALPELDGYDFCCSNNNCGDGTLYTLAEWYANNKERDDGQTDGKNDVCGTGPDHGVVPNRAAVPDRVSGSDGDELSSRVAPTPRAEEWQPSDPLGKALVKLEESLQWSLNNDPEYDEEEKRANAHGELHEAVGHLAVAVEDTERTIADLFKSAHATVARIREQGTTILKHTAHVDKQERRIAEARKLREIDRPAIDVLGALLRVMPDEESDE